MISSFGTGNRNPLGSGFFNLFAHDEIHFHGNPMLSYTENTKYVPITKVS